MSSAPGGPTGAGGWAVPPESARLLRAVLDAAPGGVLVVDGHHRVLAVNEYFLSMWGLTAGDVIGRDEEPLLAAAAAKVADPDAFFAAVRQTYGDPSADARRDTIPLRDGKVFDRIGTAISYPDGTSIGWAWYFRDVTPYVHAEAQLQRLANTLQASLLPPVPPTIPGLEVATRYVPTTEGIAVGGDFYDAFRLRANAWGVVIGDVCGKGPEAAALTSLVRYTLRAIAQHVADPIDVLDNLNTTLHQDETLGERFATVIYALVEQDVCGAWFTISCGGHPLPVVVRRAGWVDVRGQPGMALGLFDKIDVEIDRVGLGPGDALVLCTDGITESRAADGELFVDEGMPTTLLRCAADGADAQAIADRLVEAAREHAGGRFSDDVAILIVRVPPDTAVDERLREALGSDASSADLPDYPVGEPSWGRSLRPAPPREARLNLRQDPTAVPTARGFVRGVLHSWRLSELADAGDISLLASELVTNAVLHGSAPFTVIVRYDGTSVRVEVGDGSRVRPHRRSLSQEATTGRGMHLVEALAAEWGSELTVNGKRVWVSVPVPPLP